MKGITVILVLLAASFAFAWSVGCGDDDDDDDNDDGGDDDVSDDDDDATDDDGDDDDGDDDDDAADDDDDDDDDGDCPDPTVDISVCDPSNGPFSLTIDNEFYPLEVGMHLVLESEDERVEIDVLDETEEVAGVTTRVVTETEYEDDELSEVSWNWFAQAPDGTVCYFGEEVDNYEGGVLVGHHGEWRAGDDGALPGIIMPADAAVGQAYFQEYYEGEAEDMGKHTAMGESISTPAGDFDDTLSVRDYNPLEGCGGEPKTYVSGIGIVQDEDLFLTEY
ncbi:MAG: hypothetical protein M5R36_07205 [Deltaproteobacteria bacterium]|nr:hypothetical protein [Deltaproteobacteria bacterium]